LFSPGYAFLSNKVYGHEPGKIYGYENVNLWLPKNALRTSQKAFNHLLGRDGENTFLVIMNTATTAIRDIIHLNQDVFRWDVGREYAYEILEGNNSGGDHKLINGNLSIHLAPNGIAVFKINQLNPLQNLQAIRKTEELSEPGVESYYRKDYTAGGIGTLTGLRLKGIENLNDFYIYSNCTGDSVSHVRLIYQIGDEPWQEIADKSYPFEFSLRVEKNDSPVKFKWKATDLKGASHESEVFVLR